ncbi:MAG: ABC transporter permease, partial [Planctomycetales bacterium]
MSVSRLILSEIAHRKGGFLVALLSVTVAVGCLVGALTLLKADDLRTAVILDEKHREVERAGADLEEQMRKTTLKLGFNIYILPENQDINELRVSGKVSGTMPEEYAARLSDSKIMTINHLLPMVLDKVEWREIGKEVILIGTRGEVPAHERSAKKPLQEQVPPGTMIVGHGLHQEHGIEKGQEVKFNGREFEVHEVYPERQTADDYTVWIHLSEAQEMLGRQNLVNMIQALECNCATVDRLGEIRADIAKVLPGTQVIELGDKALARAEARNKAKEVAVAALAGEQAGREQLRRQHEGFAAVLVPLVILGAAAWIGFLALANVRQRSAEIGILRAIGFRSAQILAIFLGKAVLVGLVGAAVGYAAGFAVGIAWGDPPGGAEAVFALRWLLLAVLVAPLLSVIA